VKPSKTQSGATIVLSAFAILVALAALGVLGVGQTVWEREKAQRMVDLAAMAAATQLDDGPTFPLGLEVASRNGLLPADRLQFFCLANGQVTNNCGDANAVRVTLSRSISPYFIPTGQTVSVTAEATLAPVVTGLITSNLASLSTSQANVLNQVLRTLPGGGSVNLSVGDFEKLLGAEIQVGLIPLATELKAGGLTELAAVNVKAGNLLSESLTVAQGNPADISAAQGVLSRLNPVLNAVNLNVADVLAMSLDNQTQGLLNLNFGDLALATILNSARGNTITLTDAQLGLTGFGLGLNVTLLQPPQVFVGRKTPGKTPIAQGKTSQVGVRATISGLNVLGFSLANIELDTKLAGALARVDDLECRVPRSNNSLTMTIQPAVTSVCVTQPGAINNSQFTGSNTLLNCPNQSATLISVAGITASVKGGTNVQPNSSVYTFEGPAPYRQLVPLNVGSTLENTFRNIDLSLDVKVLGIALGRLTNVNALKTALDITLSSTLGQVGAALDATLGTLGVALNNADVSIQSVDCQAALLTK